jgi:hypothetical protein
VIPERDALPTARTTRTPGEFAGSTAAIRSSGSTATTRGTVRASTRVSNPVPAARSTTTPAPSGSSQSTAASGALGRSRS